MIRALAALAITTFLFAVGSDARAAEAPTPLAQASFADTPYGNLPHG